MTLVVYVVLVAAGVVLWGLLSSWFPRAGLLANGAALVWLFQSVMRWQLGIEPSTVTAPLIAMGFGWTVLGFLTAGFGLVAAIGGLIEQRQRAAERDVLPRALARR